MRVVPVIDLKGGVVVRGVAGRRDEYRPIVSQLTNDPSPGAVAATLAGAFSFREAYIADLDAIAGQTPDVAAYLAIASSLPRLWIDAGVSDVASFERLVDVGDQRKISPQLIVGLESLASLAALQQVVARHGSGNVVFSLDLKSGQPITRIEAWKDKQADEIAQAVVAIGINRMIVLDLADVGMGRGTGTLDLVRRLRTAHAQLEIIAGGGVRSVGDLHSLADAGCSAALVASALHDGRLCAEEIAQFAA
jgi:phosphoribosylformimino-5-aminoimidazole carboxamide ribotide isomerase